MEMRSKENSLVVPADDELSAEQRARISRNFRAAKALHARKRPRFEPSAAFKSLNCPKSVNEKNGRGLTPPDGIKRMPLSEISMNNSSPASIKDYRLLHKNDDDAKDKFMSEIPHTPGGTAQSCNITCLGEAPSSDDGIVLNDGGSGLENHESNLSLLNFLLDQDDCSKRFESSTKSNSIEPPVCSEVNNSLMTPNFFSNDFDESILVEIDSLCEQISAEKSEREGSSANKKEYEISFGNDNTKLDTNISYGTLKSGQGLDSVDNHVLRMQEFGTQEDTLTKGMSEESAKYIRSLNDRQREAACSDISNPLVIVAGPGSGKTSTMVGRVLVLLNEGIGPSHILAMTFTTAAAAEMRERIGTVAGKAAAKELTISTFHSFSLQLCHAHTEKLGRTPDFLIYGHGQQRKAIIEAVRLLENGKRIANHELSNITELSDVNSPKHFKDKSKKWLKFVTRAKAAGRSPEYFHKTGDETGAVILQNYNDILESCNALDYHDFISYSLKLLKEFPEVLKESQETWKAIVIDEFQDTSPMQYGLLRILASHKRITIVGDEDQSIFSFNGADVSGFDSFRQDFPTYKEITVKGCCNEDAQCAFVVDKILEMTSNGSSDKCSFGNVAVLYRRQVTGKIFQTAFRNRKIPFNIHGVAFYRKKVVRAIISMLSTTLPDCGDGSFRRVFKALLPFEKEEKKKVIEHIDKVSTVRKSSFISAASDIFSAKVSGTFKRSQLTQGRKVLATLDMISKLVAREQSISAVITSLANMIPQKYLLEQRAVLDVDGCKLLNEDNDLRSVLQYLLDDVSVFLTAIYNVSERDKESEALGNGCLSTLKAFIDYISLRESENFQSIKQENKDSVTLTTIHQSKGLEWDTVFIVKANEAEIPLLHEYNGSMNENGASVEEERRLFYVAMTRARKKLFMLYVIMDSCWQVLQPSRFLREIPHCLLETQEDLISVSLGAAQPQAKQEATRAAVILKTESSEANTVQNIPSDHLLDEASKVPGEAAENFDSNNFLKRFHTEDRTVVSHLFHQWAKKPAFHDPKRLLNKVAFVIDERLRSRKSTHKDVLRELKSCLTSDEAYHFAVYVLKWQQIPAEKRAHLMREKQEHFQKLRIESAMGSSEPTSKQIAYLQSFGCTIVPTSRLHASRLIEEYKSL